MQKKIGAVGYFECSALTGEGVAEMLEPMVRAGLQNQGFTKARKKGALNWLFR